MPDEGRNGVEARNEVIIKSCSISENCTGSMIVSFLRVLLDFETNDRVRLHERNRERIIGRSRKVLKSVLIF